MNKLTDLRRNQLVWVNFGNNVGSEQNGVRPAIIVQNDKGNKFSSTTIVIPITSQNKTKLPTHVQLSKNSQLIKPSVALCEQVKVISKERIVKIGELICYEDSVKIDNAVLISMGFVPTS